MTELLVGTKKGLFVLEGEPGAPFEVTARAFAGEPVEYAMRDPRTGRILAGVTSARSTGRRSSTPTTPPASGSRPKGVALPEGGDAGARADLGDRGRRGRRHAVRGRRPRRAVREPRRRRELGAQAQRSGSTRRGRTGSRAAAGCACTRSSPWPGEPDRLALAHLGGRRLADRRRRRDLAPRQRGPRRRATCPRTRRRRRSRSASTTCSARRSGPSGCSCSSTAASTAPTTRARAGRTSATGCRRTSASRSSSIPPTPTAPT